MNDLDGNLAPARRGTPAVDLCDAPDADLRRKLVAGKDSPLQPGHSPSLALLSSNSKLHAPSLARVPA